MRKFNQLCRSVLSGTLAMVIVSANAVLPVAARGADAGETDIAFTSDIAGDAAEGYDAEGSIVYAVEETTSAESTVLSTAYTGIVTTVTTTAVVKPVVASMAEENGYKYYITGGNAVIDCYIGEDHEVEIPESLGGLTVTEIGYAAFSGNRNITSVRIPETVKRINHDAFNGCTALVSVELPDGITSIQDGAFAGCESLKEITLPESVSRIEDNTFSGCRSLTDIRLNSNTDYIGKSAFAYCTSLSSFSIPESVTAIGNMAFSGSGLVSIDVPDTVTSMGYSVFADCKALEEISLPDGITELKSGENKGMFSGCSALKNITFPGRLSEIGDIAFADCTSLESISIPGSVNTVGKELFRNCEKLVNAEIPESVTRIEDGMFIGCVSLPSIELHDGIEYIGSKAFEDCGALDDLIIPGSVSVIGDSCFLNCESLTEIDIPASVTALGTAALAGCTSLVKAAIPDSIEELGNSGDTGLFTNDISLKEVKLPASLKTIGANTFRNCLSLEEIGLPETASAIGGYAFEGCSSLREITLPGGVVALSDKTFSGCSALSSVILPENFHVAGNYAFENCTSLADLGKKSGFFRFAEDTFTGCSSLSDERATVFTNDTPVVNVSSAASIVGGLANFSIKYDLNDWISSDLAGNGTVSFEIPMPEGLSLIESSVISDSAENKVSYAGNNSLISLSKPEGTLRFSARIEAYNANDYIIAPKIHFNSRNYSWIQRLPVMALTVPKITISAQSTVSSLECDVFGIAEPGRKVKIYVDGEPAGTVVSNQYTGRYSATVSLPAKKDSAQYNISAVCGVDKTEELSVIYSDAKPSIKKVDLIYCTHAPTDINDYMETLDITGVFTKGEHPVIQYYPKGNMRFRIEAHNSDRISFILVRSKKGSESKYLVASYDEKEKAWITPADQYFDESDHNYVPGSLNFIIIDKTDDIVDSEAAEAMIKSIDLGDLTGSYDVIDDSSCICRLEDGKGGICTECYYNGSDSVLVNGKKLTAAAVAEAAETYGFRKSDKKVLHDGVLFSMYLRTTRYNRIDADGPDTVAAYDKSVLEQVDKAYKKAGRLSYDMDDYVVFSQILVADDGSRPAHMLVTADAQIFDEEVNVNRSDYKVRQITSPGLTERIFHSLSGARLLADNDGDGKDDGSADDYLSEKAEEAVNDYIDSKTDELVHNALEDYPNASALYDGINQGADALGRLNEFKEYCDDANEEAEQVKSEDWGTDEWNDWKDNNADLERAAKIGLTVGEDVISHDTMLDALYGYTIGAIKERLDDLFDGIRRYFKRYADIAAEESGNEEDAGEGAEEKYQTAYGHPGQVKVLVDPSGIVYEGIRSKTVSGAVVTCYVFNEDTGAWEAWNAGDYDQINPLITDEAGSYAWDVPEGRYYVTCEKEGYELVKSEEFTVAPPKFDLDFNLLNEAAPAVNGYTLGEDTITIGFTKVMDIDTVNNDSVRLSGISGDITIEPQLHTEGDRYTDRFIISGDFSRAAELKLTVNSKASDYTGAALTEYSADIENIYADLILEKESIGLVAEDTYQITANKKIVSYTSDDTGIAAVDKNGLVTAVSAGSAKITAVDSTGKKAVLEVSVEAKLVIDEATAEKLEKQALNDYRLRTGVTAAESECKVAGNKCIVEIRDEDGNILDVYTLDPETGVGTDSEGEAVDLPQTGNNSVNSILWVIAAIALICSGLFSIGISGLISRRRS